MAAETQPLESVCAVSQVHWREAEREAEVTQLQALRYGMQSSQRVGEPATSHACSGNCCKHVESMFYVLSSLGHTLENGMAGT